MKWPMFLAGGVVIVGAIAVIGLRLDDIAPPAKRSIAVPVVAAAAAPMPPAPRPAVPVATADPVASPTTVAESSPTPDTKRLAGMFAIFPNQKASFDTMAGERRDPVWSPASEALLTSRYGAMPHIGGEGRSLDIYCGSDTCMVTGDLADGTNPGDVDQAMRAVQSIDLMKTMVAQGYRSQGASYGPSTTDKRPMFLTFYKRSKPSTRK